MSLLSDAEVRGALHDALHDKDTRPEQRALVEALTQSTRGLHPPCALAACADLPTPIMLPLAAARTEALHALLSHNWQGARLPATDKAHLGACLPGGGPLRGVRCGGVVNGSLIDSHAQWPHCRIQRPRHATW